MNAQWLDMKQLKLLILLLVKPQRILEDAGVNFCKISFKLWLWYCHCFDVIALIMQRHCFDHATSLLSSVLVKKKNIGALHSSQFPRMKMISPPMLKNETFKQ